MRHIITFLLLSMALGALADSIPSPAISYLPKISGTVRARWEDDTETGEQRFQIRNARVSLSGNIARQISYFIQTDLCDRGKMMILDAYGQVEIMQGLNVRAGQFRMPMGVEPFRHPGNYLFNNRSTIGRYICNYRAVGARLHYTLPSVPLLLEAGAFNPSNIGNHEVWSRTVAFGSKAQYFMGPWTFTGGFQSIKPSTVRVNFFDLAAGWHSGRWLVEGEYMYKHYTHEALSATNSWCLFGSYSMPVKAGVFNQLSFQCRWDGMTDNSDAIADDAGIIKVTDPGRDRLTAGATISHWGKSVFLDVRLNYEKIFFHHSKEDLSHAGDRLSIEMIVHF